MSANAHLQSLIAGAIMDVNKLPSLKAYLNKSHDTVSADAVLNFSAFICKVKHNFLWESFPLTFKLIHDFKLDIEIFTRFLPDYQKSRNGKALDTLTKTKWFIDFLNAYLLTKKQNPYRIVYTALQYELAMRALNDFTGVEKLPKKRKQAVSDQTSIRINGKIFIAYLYAETEAIERWRNEPNTIKATRTVLPVMYWRPSPAAEIRILKLTKESVHAMASLKDGMRLSEWLQPAGTKRSAGAFMEMLHFLIENQIVQLC